MAVTRRGYVFCAFLLSVLSVLLIVISVSSDSWVSDLNEATKRELTVPSVRLGAF